MTGQPWEIPVGCTVPEALDLGDQDLVYFLLNVGDGDAQVVLLPPVAGERQALIIDARSGWKTLGLLDELRALGVFGVRSEPRRTPLVALVVATHPHADHIAGLPAILRACRGDIAEFWHPGYAMPSAAFTETMAELDATSTEPRPMVSLPTAGVTRYYGGAAVTVLSPAVALRARFDTLGVDPNDASITLMVEFPSSRIVLDPMASTVERRRLFGERGVSSHRLLLGADAQSLAWAHVAVDFPPLVTAHSALARELRDRGHADGLSATVFKVPHHASKHGVTLELMERVSPALSLISSVGGRGSYGFPHQLALEQIREAKQSIATTPQLARRPDWRLGMHYTCAEEGGRPLGSIAIVCTAGKRTMRVYRFGDGPTDRLQLADSRRFRSRARP
ncbi:MAG TPA: hypothetical protein VIT41_09255 [Microlunatus sp.]